MAKRTNYTWAQWIEHIVGGKESFTNKEVRNIVKSTLSYSTDCWCNGRK